mgnify:CR=1 FL=1
MIPILLFVLIPLVFFGAGVLFANLVWGKYKQLAITLKQSNDNLAKRESELHSTNEHTRARLIDVETTCRTLEEELANIALERDGLQTSLEATHTALVSQQADQNEVQQTKDTLAAATARHEELATEIKTQELALRAAENKAATLKQEKDQVLALVNKLQDGVSQVDSLKQQLRDQNQFIQRIQKRRTGRRINRHRSKRTPPEAVVAKRSRSSRRGLARHSPTLTPPSSQRSERETAPIKNALNGSAKPTNQGQESSKDPAVNGHHSNSNKRPGVAKRMLGRLLGQPGQPGAEPASDKAKSRRHW